MRRRVLLIVAAGKSSRFGGYPKAFCKIGRETNADNTIHQAGKIFDRIYIGVNRSTYDQFSTKISGCEMFSIISGQGDAHSMLKCLNHVKRSEPDLADIYVCWGDAFFVDSLPFEQFVNETETDRYKAAVACAKDKFPYAWFDVDRQNRVLQSHFAGVDGITVEEGLHDQSLFFFNLDFAIQYLNNYLDYLHIPYNNDETTSDKNEVKLLNSFIYAREKEGEFVKCISISPGKVLSFNTEEELEQIKAELGL